MKKVMAKFKIGFEDKIILTIIGLSIMVIVLSGICIHQYIGNKNQTEQGKYNDFLLQQNLKMIKDKRDNAYKIINDSEKRIIELEKQNIIYDKMLKEKDKFYKNEHEKINRINTYSTRQRYADSLASKLR
jgi:hypothetical protein